MTSEPTHIVAGAVRVLTAGLLLAAAASKALSPASAIHAVAQAVDGMPVSPTVFAASIIAVEIGAGLSLLFIRWTAAPLLVSGALFAVFTCWLVGLHLWRPGTSCGCFGPSALSPETELPLSIVRNVSFLAANVAAWRLERKARPLV